MPMPLSDRQFFELELEQLKAFEKWLPIQVNKDKTKRLLSAKYKTTYQTKYQGKL
jgi:hypothetical protein